MAQPSQADTLHAPPSVELREPHSGDPFCCDAYGWPKFDDCDGFILSKVANQVHLHFFQTQQAKEIEFLHKAEEALCAAPHTPESYYSRLVKLLEELRGHTARHITAAFQVKSLCSLLTQTFYNRLVGEAIERDGRENMMLDEQGKEPYQLMHEAEWCVRPILEHEPFNVNESGAIWNITSHLLQIGSKLCALSAEERSVAFSRKRQEVEERAKAHRANNAFATYPSRFAGGCDGLPEDVLAMYSHRATEGLLGTVQRVASAPAGTEAAEKDGKCDLNGVTALHLIDAFGNDTLVTLALARFISLMPICQLADASFPAGRPPPAKADDDLLPLEQARRILETQQVIDKRGLRFTHWSPWLSWAVSLATIYHARIPICAHGAHGETQTVPPSWSYNCPVYTAPQKAHLLPDPDAQMVYDFAPRSAAGAHGLDGYRALLHTLTPLRRKLADALRGTRTCPFDAADDAVATDILERLPAALSSMRAAARRGGVVAVCVAAEREQGWWPHLLVRDMAQRYEQGQLHP